MIKGNLRHHTIESQPFTTQGHVQHTPHKSKWKKISSFTIGNSRLKMYLFTIIKFFTITFIQANGIFGDYVVLSDGENHLKTTLQIFSYCFMGILIVMFTERFIRELIAVSHKKPLTPWMNWMESTVFFLYVIFSLLTTTIHYIYLAKEYSKDCEERNVHPDEFQNRETLEQILVVEIFNVLIHVYVILDKATHFIHSNHSHSIYLYKSQLIPKNDGTSHNISNNPNNNNSVPNSLHIELLDHDNTV